MQQNNINNKLIVILGPTGSGKTELAIKLAKKFSCEIVSADSRQIYKGMIIGTASPCQKTQSSKFKAQNHNSKLKINKNKKLNSIIINEIPHYLLHIVKPNQKFNVTIYKKLAIKAIKDIQKKEKIPFLVGGTGLYIKAVVDNIEFPKIKPQKKLRKELENKTTEQLFKIYKKLDPKGAEFIDKQNKRRLIRAIEVCKATKKPFWEQRKKGNPIFDVLQIGIKLPKEKLKKKIEKRVEKMFKIGLEKEVKKLIKKYGWKTWPMQTISYQEWQSYFNKPPHLSIGSGGKEITKKELQQIIALHTCQFAKRQMTWFKSDPRINWIKNEKQAEKLIKKFK